MAFMAERRAAGEEEDGVAAVAARRTACWQWRRQGGGGLGSGCGKEEEEGMLVFGMGVIISTSSPNWIAFKADDLTNVNESHEVEWGPFYGQYR